MCRITNKNEKSLDQAKLLVICPTRDRPDKVKDMLCSFKETYNDADIIFLLDQDEPQMKKYKDVLKDEAYCIAPRMPVTDYINQVFEMYPRYKFYSVTNDDFLYLTTHWDEMLCNKGTISYGDDGMNGARLPTTSVIDGDICRALGWLQMPGLIHLYGDVVWRDIGTTLGILEYHPEVDIEHNHYMNKKADKDETYKFTNSRGMYERDEQAYILWRITDMKDDILKIRRTLCI